MFVSLMCNYIRMEEVGVEHGAFLLLASFLCLKLVGKSVKVTFTGVHPPTPTLDLIKSRKSLLAGKPIKNVMVTFFY